MTTPEAARLDLYNGLSDLLGSTRADTLMTYLPNFRFDDLAKGSDFDDLRIELGVLKTDVGVLRSDVDVLKFDVGVLRSDLDVLKFDVSVLRSDVDVLKFDVGVLRSDVDVLKMDVGVLRSDVGGLKSDVAKIESDLKDGLTALNERIDRLFVALVAGLLTIVAAMAGILFSVA